MKPGAIDACDPAGHPAPPVTDSSGTRDMAWGTWLLPGPADRDEPTGSGIRAAGQAPGEREVPVLSRGTRRPPDELRRRTRLVLYRQALVALIRARVPFLVGGGYALAWHTGIARPTRDLDLFVRRWDCPRVLQVLSAGGFRTDLTFPHWLAKAACGPHVVDVIFNSGNGVAEVDDAWFAHAEAGVVLDAPVQLCPREEMIWSKAFIMERERYDGADVAHLLRAGRRELDWARLLARFDAQWRVLLSHLVLFGFIYPGERARIPGWVMAELLGRLQDETSRRAPDDRLCQGTMLSRAQYLADIERLGYRDARRRPPASMSPRDIARWTAAIEGSEGDAGR